jgi:hypothetical protein
MTRKSSFRIGLVFTPKSVVSVGVINGNSPEAYEFMRQIQPVIEDFIGRIRKEAKGKLDKFVTSSEEEQR